MDITKRDMTMLRRKARKGRILKALQQLEEENGGVLTPDDVLRAARETDHPLHQSFEWNDGVAAEKYRKMQAYVILTTVRVEYMGEKRKAYFNATVTVGEGESRGYFPIQRVMNDEELRLNVLDQALKEIEHAQKKYTELSELAGIINEDRLAEVRKAVDQRRKGGEKK
jgi:hypothetical protein